MTDNEIQEVPLSPAWRMAHATLGDKYLQDLKVMIESGDDRVTPEGSTLVCMLIQAHYQAAAIATLAPSVVVKREDG